MAICTLQFPLAARSAEPPAQPPVNNSASATADTPAAAAAPTAPAAPVTKAVPKAPPVQSFSILEYRIEGNTVLPVIEVERAVTPYLGENKSIKDVEAARTQLERAYHDRGYKTVLVNIPPQRVGDGTVRLVVTEAAVGKLKIAGSRYHSLHVIRDKLSELNPDSVPDFSQVQKQLADVNRSQDMRVTPVLKASQTPGRVDVDLNVKDDLPLHAIFDIDNRYSANTTHTRATAQLSYENLFQRNQSVSLQFQVAPWRISDAKVASLSYVLPAPNHSVVALYAVHSDSNVAAVGDLNVIGKGDIFGIRLITPLPTSSPDFYNSFTAGADYKKFKQTVVLQGATETIDSPVSYAPFTLQYSGTWLSPASQSGAGRAATTAGRSNTNLDLGVSFLIRSIGTNWRQFANKRANAGTSYITLRPSLAREQILPGKWSLAGQIDGQLTSGPLINNEQFSAGGADSVRGYTESERLGDNGVRGSLELRTPQLLAGRLPQSQQSYVFLFCDAAKLTILQPLPKQDSQFTLASAGLGLRFKADGFTVGLDGARILKDGYVTSSGRYRGLFKFSYAY
jgi:hemolysin activation/secretion protein